MPQPAPRHRRSPLASVHPHHPFWGHVYRALAAVWWLIRWVIGAIVIGGLGTGILVTLAVSDTTGVPDPRDWAIIRPALAHPIAASAILAAIAVLAGVSFRAHRAYARATAGPDLTSQRSEYVLRRVDSLDPAQYVPRFVAGIYLRRRDAKTGAQADEAARVALRSAAAAVGPGAPRGICVFGKPMEGKTRLAWEAICAELLDWTLVRWPHGASHPFDWERVRGAQIALWLDDLQEYANPNEASTLNDLSRRFAEAGARLAIVATCRDGDDEQRARAQLGNLIEQVREVRPADITQAEADQLAAALEKVERPGEDDVHRDEFDGTPGSLLLGVARMRDQRYPRLPEDARRVLRTMKLLRSARIYSYPEPRVRVVAGDRFGLPAGDGPWGDVRDALVREGFIALGAASPDDKRALDPVADVYLERAVPDYPVAGATEADDWPALQAILTRERDASALISLGIAFNERPLGNLRANQEHAVACYNAALTVHTREAAPADWAMTQNNLGAALADQAELAEGAARAALLGQAVAASRAALTVRTREAAPAGWAMTQNNLAVALQRQAQLAEGAARAALLGQAVAAYQAALTVYTEPDSPYYHHLVQQNMQRAETLLEELQGDG